MKYGLYAIFAIALLDAFYAFLWIHLQDLRLHRRTRDNHGLLLPLLHSQEKENNEVIEAILFIIAHTGIMASVYSLSYVGMIDWFSGWFGDSRIPAAGFWVPNLVIYPLTAFVKKIAYPETDAKPIFWAMFSVIGLILLITLVKSLEMGVWQVLLAAVIFFIVAIVFGYGAKMTKRAWS